MNESEYRIYRSGMGPREMNFRQACLGGSDTDHILGNPTLQLQQITHVDQTFR